MIASLAAWARQQAWQSQLGRGVGVGFKHARAIHFHSRTTQLWSRRTTLFASTGLTALAIAAAVTPARAGEFDVLTGLGTLGGTTSFANGLSANGAVAVGYSYTAGNAQRAFRWSGGVMTNLGTLGGTSSFATQTSADGAVVVGRSGTAGGVNHAFRWSGGIMTDLGTIGGTTSAAYGVSADGAVVVGSARIAGDSETHAFRWSGGVMADLGTLGGTFSTAYGVSADGAVVIGRATAAGDVEHHPFRWSGGVMTNLGTFGGTYGNALGVSANGAVVVGYSNLPGDAFSHAFRWSGGTMTDLGTLGGIDSYATAVSADGSVVVGGSLITGSPGYRAFRWKAATGMQSISSLLTASGVNITGWTLSLANGVSADGTVILGTGTNPSGNTEAWITRCSPGCALLSSGTVSRSFSGQSAIGQTASAAIGFTLGTMTEVATQTGVGADDGKSRYRVFGYGGYDTDPAASGTLGMTASLSDKIVAGALVSANAVRTDMVYDGKAKMAGASAGAFVARTPDAGLQWLFSIAGITLEGDVTRGYLNGNTPAFSQGSTGGNGYGATARVGWTFEPMLRGTQMTPFASYTWTRMNFGGYTETGGPFPALFKGFSDAAQIARAGVDTRYTFASGTWVWGTLAYAHRLAGSAPSSINGTIIGLFDQTAPAAPVAKEWAESHRRPALADLARRRNQRLGHRGDPGELYRDLSAARRLQPKAVSTGRRSYDRFASSRNACTASNSFSR